MKSILLFTLLPSNKYDLFRELGSERILSKTNERVLFDKLCKLCTSNILIEEIAEFVIWT